MTMTTTPRTLEIVLDLPTDIIFNANHRLNHYAKGARVQELRAYGAAAAHHYVQNHPEFVPFTHYKIHCRIFNIIRNLNIDPINYSETLKPIIDGFSGRLWEDDNANYLLEYTCTFGGYYRSPKTEETTLSARRFHITVTEANPDDYITTPEPKPELDTIAAEWVVPRGLQVPHVPHDGDINPTTGLEKYYKTIDKHLREKANPKPKKKKKKPTTPEPKPLIEVNIPQPDTHYKIHIPPPRRTHPQPRPPQLVTKHNPKPRTTHQARGSLTPKTRYKNNN